MGTIKKDSCIQQFTNIHTTHIHAQFNLNKDLVNATSQQVRACLCFLLPAKRMT